MRIHIEELCFETIIGLLEHERTTPQKVIVTCKVDYAYSQGTFIDYAQAASLIQATMLEGRFVLLEEAIGTLAKRLKVSFPATQRLYLKISKPDILPNARVGMSETFTYEP